MTERSALLMPDGHSSSSDSLCESMTFYETNGKRIASHDVVDFSSDASVDDEYKNASNLLYGESTSLIGNTRKQRACCFQVRYHLAFLVFLGFTIMTAMRQNVHVSMVAMINGSAIEHENGDANLTGDDSNTCPRSGKDDGGRDGEFLWNTRTQEFLLAGYFYGYVISQIPGGWFSDKFGMRWVFGLSILASSVCNLLGPLAASTSTTWYFVDRLLSGLCEGVTLPATMSLWSKWAHPIERSRLNTIGLAGLNSGNFIGGVVSGYLNDLGFGGWSVGFYLFGMFGCLWFILWIIVARSDPEDHPWISVEEKEYLQEGLKLVDKKTEIRVPWCSLLMSPALLVLALVHFINAQGIFTLITNLPLYFNTGLGISVQKAGIYSSIPYGCQLLVMLSASALTDFILHRDILSRQITRKLMTFLGLMSAGIFLTLAAFARCNISQAVTFHTLAMGLDGFAFSGYFCAILDISGPFAGSVMGAVNTLGTLGGIVGPYIVGVLTEIQTDITGWQSVIWIFAGLYMFGAIFYAIFGTAKKQYWATTDEDSLKADF